MTKFTETYPVLTELPDIVLLSGGGGGEAVAPGFVDRANADGLSVAIITGTADSGSKTGRLRELVTGTDEYGREVPLPAVGDPRRVQAAVAGNRAGELSETRLGAEATPHTVRAMATDMRSLISTGYTEADRYAVSSLYRVAGLAEKIIDTDGSLKGHTLGNLVLAQLFIDQQADLGSALAVTNSWLDTKATVMPISTDPHHLVMQDAGNIYHTEGVIDELEIVDPHTANVWLEHVMHGADVRLNGEAAIAMQEARMNVALQGSLFTTHGSILTVPGVTDALRRNAGNGGLFASLANLTVERDTKGFEAPDFIRTIGRLSGRLVDVAVVNSNTESIPAGKTPLTYDQQTDLPLRATVVAADILDTETVIEKDPNDPIAHLRATTVTSGPKAYAALREFVAGDRVDDELQRMIKVAAAS